MSALFHPWSIDEFGIHTAIDGDQSLLPRETAAEGGVPGVRGGAGGGLSDNASSCTAWCWSGLLGYTSASPLPTPVEGSYLFGFPPGGTHASLDPSGGIPGWGNQPEQPMGSLFPLTRAVFHCDP